MAVSVTGGQKEDSLMTNVTDITTQVDVPAPDDDGTFMQQVCRDLGPGGRGGRGRQ